MPIIVLGPPGAGKGTQSGRLSKILDIPHISTGEVLRAEIAAGTHMGMEAKRRIDHGEFMPDAIMDTMISSRIDAADCRGGFILDGYPRTLAQAEAFETIMEEVDVSLRAVFVLEASTPVLIQRIIGRARSQGKAARVDDTEEVVRRRIEIYEERTAPIVDLYDRQGILTRIDGTAPIGTITNRMLDVLEMEPASSH